ncbi:hypothetical protein [uncultured Vibrio sp.]|uniref:hypothetical protein n=1 Tax=uncultured Vibrio sp. TaxID=114054 RepID=UPI002607BF5F|nr:hypothetical protein [uncultured Vibrio sp.]
MSIEEAWSVEYGDFVDPETAYELFWNGVIQDKQKFICPFCRVDMTCVNLDVEEQNWNIHPHFRGRPRHGEKCEESRSSPPSTRSEKQSNNIGKTDVLCFERPKGFFSIRNENLQSQNSVTRPPQKRKHSTTQNRYSIRPLVSKFIAYRTQGTLADNFISIEDETWSYAMLFTGIYHQKQLITERPVIYWGLARIQWLEHTQSYLLKFCESFHYKERDVYPSLFIPKRAVDNYPVKRLLEKRLNKATEDKDNRAFIFVYGAPVEKVDSKNDNVFLNFKLDSLDFVEVRSLSLFDHLKQKKDS